MYVDAEEMEKVFDEVFDRETRGSGLPGAEPALDEKPARSRAGSRHHSKQVLSEDDDEYAMGLRGYLVGLNVRVCVRQEQKSRRAVRVPSRMEDCAKTLMKKERNR